MSKILPFPDRRNFLKASAVLTTGLAGLSMFPQPALSEDSDAFIVGPKKGYSPQIGTVVSEMGFMRWQVLHSVKDMTQKDLDFLLDDKANRIGALLLHL
ncbi:MAG TPA: twin-arginine translocation signal domain-containing protein, partial [Candidatus Acidoferrales bacterium]